MWPVLGFKTTWPFAISIKAGAGGKGQGKYTSAQEPLEGRQPPRHWSWVQNSPNEQLETIKVPPCQLSLFPLKPRVDANWQEDVSAADPALDPSTAQTAHVWGNLPDLTLAGRFCRGSPWPCGEHRDSGSPADLATLPRLNVLQEDLPQARAQAKVTELFGASIWGFAGTCNLVL